MKEFIIIFRECLEAGLIVGIIYTFIHINKIEGQKRNLWLGVLGGIVASVLIGCIFFFLGGTIPPEYETLFEGILNKFFFCDRCPSAIPIVVDIS